MKLISRLIPGKHVGNVLGVGVFKAYEISRHKELPDWLEIMNQMRYYIHNVSPEEFDDLYRCKRVYTGSQIFTALE